MDILARAMSFQQNPTQERFNELMVALMQEHGVDLVHFAYEVWDRFGTADFYDYLNEFDWSRYEGQFGVPEWSRHAAKQDSKAETLMNEQQYILWAVCENEEYIDLANGPLDFCMDCLYNARNESQRPLMKGVEKLVIESNEKFPKVKMEYYL